MSRKRKAEHELQSAAPRREEQPKETPGLKSARNALAAKQGVVVSTLSTSIEGARPLSDGDLKAQPILLTDESDSSTSSGEATEDEVEVQHGRRATDPAILLTEAQYPRSWKRARELIVGEILSQHSSSARILITGSQNSGKSTFAQYLASTLLQPPLELGLKSIQSVALLHLDPSRGTSGLVGHVCLHVFAQESNAHLMTPLSERRHERNIPVGLFGQKEDSRHYLAAIAELLKDFRKLNTTMPLFICCPSIERESERGMSAQTVASLQSLIEPNHICFLHNRSQNSQAALNLLQHTRRLNVSLWDLELLQDGSSMVKDSASARQGRFQQHYFFGDSLDHRHEDLSSHKPYAIAYRQNNQQNPNIMGVCAFGDLPPNHPYMMSRLLNCSVVSITTCNELDFDQTCTGQGDLIPYMHGSDTTKLLLANSIGLGLIRGIDHKQGVLHIITPHHVARQLESVPAEQIILVHGVSNSPNWAFVQDKLAGSDPGYLGRARKGMQTVKSRRFKKK